MCRWLIIALLVSHAAAFAQTFDLRPYGFAPIRNQDYRPHEDSSQVQYLSDGSLLVAFHSRVMISGARDPVTRLLQPVDLLHLDAQTGKLLGRTQEMVSRNVRYLWPTEHGFLLLAEDKLRIFGLDLKLQHVFRVPRGASAIGFAPALNDLTVYLRSGEQTAEVKMLDLSSFAVTDTYTIVNGSHPAFLRDGYAVVAHDKDGKRVLKFNDGGIFRRQPLPQLPCFSQLEAVGAEAVAAFTCEEFAVYAKDGDKLFQGKLSGDEGAPTLFLAAHAPRFVMVSVLGFAGYPRDEQRIFGKGFHVTVFDLNQRKQIFSTKISPLPKLGGSFSLSPDGRRLAVLKDGEVEQIVVN